MYPGLNKNGDEQEDIRLSGAWILQLVYMLAMFRLAFRIRVDMLNFLVKRPWGQNVSLLQNLEVIYTFSIIN